jgi:hypothetical protein
MNSLLFVHMAHVNGHQDRATMLWHELDFRAKINVLADSQVDDIYRKPPRRTGLFPSCWIPGIRAALFHGDECWRLTSYQRHP